MRGTTKHTRQQIQDELDRLKARMSVGGRASAGDAVGRDHAVRTARPCSGSLAEVLREPAFPAKEFQELQQENLAAIEQQRSEPDAVAPNVWRGSATPTRGKVPLALRGYFDESLASYRDS